MMNLRLSRSWLFFCWLPLLMGASLENQVVGHASPYLSMHADDPVKWQVWDKKVLQRAKQENKMIYVTIGYFSCYWCHVMQKESFKDAEIATILNKYYIPVIVDRELNPALDARLLEFVELYRGVAGWPLNVILTPDGYPVLGGVYIPQAQFKELLMKLIERWQVDEENLRRVSKQAAIGQRTLGGSKPRSLTPDFVKEMESKLLQHTFQFADEMSGGFGDQTKFPMVPQLLALLDLYQTYSSTRLGEFLRLTLDQMAAQGLQDHLEGGFYRYTTDPTWQTPHFEKMLYDNALLASLYLRAAQVLEQKSYEIIARNTLDFVLKKMKAPAGGFYASLSALDDKGTEGGYYLWQPAELEQILGKQDAEFARFAFRMSSAPEFEGSLLPLATHDVAYIAENRGLSPAKIEERLLRIKKDLLQAREKRNRPIDTKVLTAWNGLLLQTLAQAASLPAGQAYGEAARDLRDYLADNLLQGDVLYKMAAINKSPVAAGLDDYTYLVSGLLSYARISKSRKKDITLANKLTATAWSKFNTDMGWLLADDALLPIMQGQSMIVDDVLPSPSRLLIVHSLHLAEVLKDKALAKKARSQLLIDRGKMMTEPFSYAGYITTMGKAGEALFAN